LMIDYLRIILLVSIDHANYFQSSSFQAKLYRNNSKFYS
jgi:hypothetical protein